SAASTSAPGGSFVAYWRRWSGSEPELAPIRIGIPAAFARETTCSTLSGPPMLPGLMRTLATPASIARRASEALKWMSAMIGSGEPATITGSASASVRPGTATRASSQPASARRRIWPRVASTSFVSVRVIDWTTTGDPPPIGTSPTRIRFCEAISAPEDTPDLPGTLPGSEWGLAPLAGARPLTLGPARPSQERHSFATPAVRGLTPVGRPRLAVQSRHPHEPRGAHHREHLVRVQAEGRTAEARLHVERVAAARRRGERGRDRLVGGRLRTAASVADVDLLEPPVGPPPEAAGHPRERRLADRHREGVCRPRDRDGAGRERAPDRWPAFDLGHAGRRMRPARAQRVLLTSPEVHDRRGEAGDAAGAVPPPGGRVSKMKPVSVHRRRLEHDTRRDDHRARRPGRGRAGGAEAPCAQHARPDEDQPSHDDALDTAGPPEVPGPSRDATVRSRNATSPPPDHPRSGRPGARDFPIKSSSAPFRRFLDDRASENRAWQGRREPRY